MNKYVKMAILVVLLGAGAYFGVDLTPIANVVKSMSDAPVMVGAAGQAGAPDGGE